MRKTFKRVIAVAATASILALSMIGCSKTTECYVCKKEKKCTQEEYDGAKVWVCESCVETIEEWKALGDSISNLFD